jgi:hypothetical protein
VDNAKKRKLFIEVINRKRRAAGKRSASPNAKGRFGGFPKGYKAPYKGKDPRRATVE